MLPPRFSIDGIKKQLQLQQGSFNKNPTFLVRSVEDGYDVLMEPDIIKNWKKSLRQKPKHRKVVLVPCAATKPFPQSPSHKHGYLKALDGKNIDIWIVSEPLGIVPYAWNNTYPNNDYDFPPKYVKGKTRELLIERFAAWKKIADKYKKVYFALPGHHLKLIQDAGLEGEDLSISSCRKSSDCAATQFRATTASYIDYLARTIR